MLHLTPHDEFTVVIVLKSYLKWSDYNITRGHSRRILEIADFPSAPIPCFKPPYMSSHLIQ